MRAPSRPPFITAFSLPFGPADATYSREEEQYRRDMLCREVRALMPAANRLPSSRLVDRLGIRDGQSRLDFDLEFTGQLNLPFSAGQVESVARLLERDIETLRRSAGDQQKAIFLEACPQPDASGERSSRRATRQDIARWALMRRHRGETLLINFANGPLVFRFPEYPAFRCDGKSRLISAIVDRVEPLSVRLRGFRYEDQLDPSTSERTNQQHSALIPAGPSGFEIGMDCAAAALRRTRIRLRVITALDFLTGRVSHFEIEAVEN